MTYYIVIKTKSLEQGSPTSEPWTSTSCQISGGIRLEIKCTINVICLNHPQTIPTSWSFLKLVLVPKRLETSALEATKYTLNSIFRF